MRSTKGHSTELDAQAGEAKAGFSRAPLRPASTRIQVFEHRPTLLADSYAFCRDVARCQAGNFYWSFRLLPKPSRAAMCTLYAFMRQTDDLADREAPAEERAADLAAWRKCLDDVLDDTVDGEIAARSAERWQGFPALAETVRQFGIPRKYLHAVIDGMAFDLGPVHLRDEAEFEMYCWHVASAVGLCCLHIWGYDSQGGRAENLAERLGLAFQRTNILRDVAEDFARGRVYLPADDLSEFHVHEADLGAGKASDGLKALVARHETLARAEYEAAGELLPLITPECRPMLRAIARIYEAVLDTIRKQGHDVLVRRASIPKWRKVAIMIGAMFG